MKKLLLIFICIMTMFSFSMQTFAVDSSVIDAVLNDTADYVYKAVPIPEVGSIGGEWAVLGLARSGYDIPDEFYREYYKNIEKHVEDCGGILHEKKYTEYSRLVLALTSIGKNPADVAGYNLLTPLGDYNKTIWQGINGPIYALIALDCGNYEMPVNEAAEIQASREMYINRILEGQSEDGGWSLSGESDPDITGMALQALSNYTEREDVKAAVDRALLCMSDKQNQNAGFTSCGAENLESCVQMIVALCELGLPVTDTRFVKNGKTMFDNLLTFYVQGKGFLHTSNQNGSAQMASEQGLYALAALKRASANMCSLYDMTDRINISGDENASGLPGKSKDIRIPDITLPGKSFDDITRHPNFEAIKALAERKIIDGKSENIFDPDAAMTRSEFAAITVKALGLPLNNTDTFCDVKASDWFAGYIGAAYSCGIVNGISENEFAPNGIITRQEAAVMTVRAASLCGIETAIGESEARDILAGFTDYINSAEWSRAALAVCYKNGILSDLEIEILPEKAITRAEIAQMLFNMLDKAMLI